MSKLNKFEAEVDDSDLYDAGQIRGENDKSKPIWFTQRTTRSVIPPPKVGMRGSVTTAPPGNNPFKNVKPKSSNKNTAIIGVVVFAFVAIVIGLLIWQMPNIIAAFESKDPTDGKSPADPANADGFQSRNYSHTLRQNLNPFQKWSTSQHESQTYQYPKNIPVYKPMHGEVTQYMYAKNPNFD